MSGVVPWLLGAILSAFIMFPLGWVARVAMARRAGNGERSPCVDEIYAHLEQLHAAVDKLRDSDGDTPSRLQALESRMQLVDQEWNDFYQKSRALEERIRKREQRAKQRDASNDEDGDDQALLELMQAGHDDNQDGGLSGAGDLRRLAFEARQRRR